MRSSLRRRSVAAVPLQEMKSVVEEPEGVQLAIERRRSVAAGDQHVFERRRSVAARDQKVNERRRSVAARDQQVNERRQSVAAGDQHVIERRRSVAGGPILDQIYKGSTGWRTLGAGTPINQMVRGRMKSVEEVPVEYQLIDESGMSVE